MRSRSPVVARRSLAVIVLLAACAAVAVIAWQAGLLGDGGAKTPPSPTSTPAPSSASSRSPSSAASAAPSDLPGDAQGGQRAFKVCAWSRGDGASLTRAVAAHAIDQVAFDWYHSRADGSLRPEGEDLALVDRCHELHVQVLATITNRVDHEAPFDGDISAAILRTKASRAAHIDRLVDLCATKRFDGVDMDWEELKPADRDRFSAFISELADRLHADGKVLSVAVYPKTSEPGDWDALKAQDYAALGAAVDEFKVMTYSFSGPWGEPGPQQPLSWAGRVLDFAASRVPPKKVYMGLPFFGFDWHGGSADYVLWEDVAAARRSYGGRLGRDADSGEAVLRFDASDGAHVVYFQDHRAVSAKLQWLAEEQPQLAGVAIWVMGGEDPRFWNTIATALAGTP